MQIFFVAMFLWKHKPICICWVVPKVTSPPAQSYAAQNQCYTDKWLSQISGREPLSLRAEGTNAPSTVCCFGSKPREEIENAPKNFPQKWQVKNSQHSTRTAHGDNAFSRAVDTSLCSDNNHPSEIRKNFHFLLCFWCVWTLRSSHIVTLSVSLAPRNATWSFVVSACFWVSDIICWNWLALKITGTSADQFNTHMWMGWWHTPVCVQWPALLHFTVTLMLRSQSSHTHTHWVSMVYGDFPNT